MRSFHLDQAHNIWRNHLQKDDLVIDATCGNGHDAAILAPLCHTLHCFDIQKAAIEKTREKLKDYSNVIYHNASHESFPPFERPPKLIVYNLGYLPGSDKSIKTLPQTTLSSIKQALALLPVGGIISITTYPGHLEGLEEENLLLPFFKSLTSFTVHRYEVINKATAPKLTIIKKLC